MYSMPSTSGENEHFPPQAQADISNIIWSVGLTAVVYIACAAWISYRDPETKLELLHTLMNSLHKITRYLGNLAINVEKQYYDYADSLHS